MQLYGTDENGNENEINQDTFQNLNNPGLATYPWDNWQFPTESVSLGYVYTALSDPLGTIDETGPESCPFETQLDFELGSGLLANPVSQNFTRSATTIYYTTNESTNTSIAAFAEGAYQSAPSVITHTPTIQSAQYLNNPASQNPGNGGALVNSPYFMVRQNVQNRDTAIEYPQYATSIYAPLYQQQYAIHPEDYDFRDQLQYSLNYDNNSSTFVYGNVADSNAVNGTSTSLQMNATSSDGDLSYSSMLQTWSDSDKLEITGSTSNATSTAMVKDIWADLSISSTTGATYNVLAAYGQPATAVTSTLNNNDDLWTNDLYSYSYGNIGPADCDIAVPCGTGTLVYNDYYETVPPLAIPISLPNEEYDVTAYVVDVTQGPIMYRYSLDGVNWSSFTVASSSANGIVGVNLGLLPVNGQFYIDDDGVTGSGVNAWAGWDRIALQPTTFNIIQPLGSNVYDLRLWDNIYGYLGLAIQVNAPTSSVAVMASSTDLRVYLLQASSAQPLSTFNYPFDIELWPHMGWLNSASDFTALHTQAALTYDSRTLYIPSGIHTGRTNTVYANGAVSYSSDPYNSSTEVNFTVAPPSDSVTISINDWQTTGTYHKEWTESSSNPDLTNVVHTIGNLGPNQQYAVTLDGIVATSTITGAGCVSGICLADAAGTITFTYTGQYSSHTFDITAVSTAVSNVGSGGSIYIPPTPAVPTSTLVASGPGLQMPDQTSKSPLTVILINDNGTFYLVTGAQSEGITNPGILNSYGFSFNQAQPHPTAEDLNLPIGPNLLPNNGALVKTAQNPTIYLISEGQRYGFTSPAVFNDLGFNFSNVLTVTAPELDQEPIGAVISSPTAQHLPGVDINDNGTIYRIGPDNQLHGYPSLAVYNSWHLVNDFSNIVPANAADVGLPVGILVIARIVN